MGLIHPERGPPTRSARAHALQACRTAPPHCCLHPPSFRAAGLTPLHRREPRSLPDKGKSLPISTLAALHLFTITVNFPNHTSDRSVLLTPGAGALGP